MIKEVSSRSPNYAQLLSVAAAVGQAKYLATTFEYALASVVLGAFEGHSCLGFLRFLIQVLGAEKGRPPIVVDGAPLLEGYVEAFAVLPDYRRRGIGQQLQTAGLHLCRQKGCYQMRSRSPATSRENYLLKLKMGYAIQPSLENDSYYFIKQLLN